MHIAHLIERDCVGGGVSCPGPVAVRNHLFGWDRFAANGLLRVSNGRHVKALYDRLSEIRVEVHRLEPRLYSH